MRESLLKFLGLRLDSITQYFISLNYYGEIIDHLDQKVAEATKINETLQTQVKDDDYIKSITYYEQRALAENAQNYSSTIKHLNGIIEQLIAKKFTRNISQCFYYLDDSRLAIKDMVSGYYELTDLNKNVKVKSPINNEKFEKASYKIKLTMIQAALVTLRDDIRDEDFALEDVKSNRILMFQDNLITNLGKIEILLQEEVEEIEANGMPQVPEYELPKMVEPDLPEAPDEEPEPEIDAEQTTINFEDAVKEKV